MPGPNAAGSLACSVSIRFYNYVSILEQCPLSEDTHWLQTLPTGPAHLIPWNFRMTWKKIQGLAETLAAWKVSQNPRSSQHHDELIFFSERGKEKNIRFTVNWVGRGHQDYYTPREASCLGSVREQFVLVTE